MTVPASEYWRRLAEAQARHNGVVTPPKTRAVRLSTAEFWRRVAEARARHANEQPGSADASPHGTP